MNQNIFNLNKFYVTGFKNVQSKKARKLPEVELTSLELNESDRLYGKWLVENIDARKEFLFDTYHYFYIKKVKVYE